MLVQASLELCEALQKVSDIERHLVGIGRRGDPAHRRDLIHWRRTLVEQTGMLGSLIEKDQLLARSPDAHEQMSRIFSEFRQALWHHLARWPAVRIDEDVHAYTDSARETYGKGDVFWAWCATNLDLQRH